MNPEVLTLCLFPWVSLSLLPPKSWARGSCHRLPWLSAVGSAEELVHAGHQLQLLLSSRRLLQPSPQGTLRGPVLDHSWGSRLGWSPSEERLLLPGQRPTAAGAQTLGQGSCPGWEAIPAPRCLPQGTETSPPTRRLRRYGTRGTSHCGEWGVFQAKPTCHPMRALNQGHII